MSPTSPSPLIEGITFRPCAGAGNGRVDARTPNAQGAMSQSLETAGIVPRFKRVSESLEDTIHRVASDGSHSALDSSHDTGIDTTTTPHE